MAWWQISLIVLVVVLPLVAILLLLVPTAWWRNHEQQRQSSRYSEGYDEAVYRRWNQKRERENAKHKSGEYDLASIAQGDEDPKVRAEAVRRVQSARTLRSIARDDKDPGVRAEAVRKLSNAARNNSDREQK